jgi:hypothetical protein
MSGARTATRRRRWAVVAAAVALLCAAGCKKDEPVARPNVPSTDPGWFERADCEVLAGWACDPRRPDDAINVRVYDGDTLLKAIRADIARPDVAKAKKNNGKHGFALALPPSLRDGRRHAVRVFVAETNIELNHSPRVIQCPPGGRK